MATTKKKAAKKAAKPNGAAELKGYRAAVQNLKTAGSALVKVATINKDLRSKRAVQLAVHSAQNLANAIAKKVHPPTTTVTQ